MSPYNIYEASTNHNRLNWVFIYTRADVETEKGENSKGSSFPTLRPAVQQEFQGLSCKDCANKEAKGVHFVINFCR